MAELDGSTAIAVTEAPTLCSGVKGPPASERYRVTAGPCRAFFTGKSAEPVRPAM